MATAGSSQGGHSSKRFVEMLLPRAISFCEDKEGNDEISFLYRNKPAKYFLKNKNVMHPEEKDSDCHPQSPIHGTLGGIFFSVTLWRGELPTRSPFGDTRICIAIEALFKEDFNLYFADFYCYEKKKIIHHVRLVLTKTGTKADEFCEENLPKLDPLKNPFLFRKEGKYYTPKYPEERGFWVDVIFTESVDIDSLKKTYGNENVYFKDGFPDSKEGTYNMEIDKSCTICNLSPEEQERLRRGSRRGEGSREEGSSEEGSSEEGEEGSSEEGEEGSREEGSSEEGEEGSREEGSSEEGEEGSREEDSKKEGSREEDSRKEGSREEEAREEHQGDEVYRLAKRLERM